MNGLIIKFIQFIHCLILLFVVIIPFTNDKILLRLHFITVPFLYAHWIMNNNTCALTVLEKNLQKQMHGKIDEDECFTCKLINPVFNFHKNAEQMDNFIYIVTFLLWTITVYKLFIVK
jgi:hypothetical protein